MLISEYSQYLKEFEENPSRNYKVELLAQMISELNYEEISAAMYLLNGRVVPKYESLEFNLSEKLILRALESLGGESVVNIFKEIGDIGIVAEKVRSGLRKGGTDINHMELLSVYGELKEMALVGGKGSQESKLKAYSSLLIRVNPLSARYITRVIIGKLRLGLNEKTILDAVSWSVGGDKSMRDLLDRAYGVRADLGALLRDVKSKGIDCLKDLEIVPGVPVASKLVEREKGVEKIFERLGECIVQPKFDGLRAQIHYARNGFTREVKGDGIQQLLEIGTQDKVGIFSRNMEQITGMFPDIVQMLETLKIDSVVFDSEIIGYNEDKDEFIPFQETMQRKRKYGVEAKINDIPIRVYIFDCLYIDGKDISREALDSRLEVLKSVIPKNNKMLKVSENVIVKSETQLSEVFEKYVAAGLEGLIAKVKDGPYEPGTRNYEWIKLKATSKVGFVDSVDAVVLGYYKGKGQRTKLGVGALLLGIYDKEKDSYFSLAKLGTGVKDDEWIRLKKMLSPIELPSKLDKVIVDKNLYPDIWVEPKVVIEVDYDQITKSKSHAAARDSFSGDGLSLRFPRMKQIREKNAEQATSVEELVKMYKLQS